MTKLAHPLDSSSLGQHGIFVLNTLHPRQAAVKVRNFHFYVFHKEVFTSGSSTFSVNNDEELSWKNGDEFSFHGMKQAIELALQSLYLLDIPIGECIVQRTGKHRFAVASISQRLTDDLTEDEKRKIHHTLMRNHHSLQSFGTDIELLAHHHKSKKWVPASAFLKHNQSIGWDNYTVVKNKKIIHPVIELRSEPSRSAQGFYENIGSTYEKLEQLLMTNHLQAVAGSNPFSHLFLGGHLHVGNQLASFNLIKRLDAFLTIPIAILQDKGAPARRKSHGRLGSVRINDYNGYEYRTLPSWYSLIPVFFPVIQWFVYLQTAGDKIKAPVLQEEIIIAYYNDHKQRLSLYLDECIQVLRHSMPKQDYDEFARPFFQWLYENHRQGIGVCSQMLML